jgi:hypothetical protein
MIAQRDWFPSSRPEPSLRPLSRADEPAAPDAAVAPPAPVAEESLVTDARDGQTTAQIVEVKLTLLLRGGVLPLSCAQTVRAGTCRGR